MTDEDFGLSEFDNGAWQTEVPVRDVLATPAVAGALSQKFDLVGEEKPIEGLRCNNLESTSQAFLNLTRDLCE